jgi:hypothetical protein
LAEDLAYEWVDRQAPGWENVTVPDYVNALARWLHDSDGFYTNRGEEPPTDPWPVVRDALQAAVIYE